MAEDLPGPPGSSNRDDRPGQRPTELLGGPARPPQPPPSSGQPGGSQQPPGSGPPPQQQPAAQQYGSGQPAWPTPAPGPPTEGMAVAALVIAIVGFFVCPPVGAIVALVLASNARQRIEASGGRLSGLEQARAARIIAIIELVLTAIVVLVLALGAVVAVNTSGGQDEQVPVPPTVPAPRSMNAASSSS
jgi:hypothetical protein